MRRIISPHPQTGFLKSIFRLGGIRFTAPGHLRVPRTNHVIPDVPTPIRWATSSRDVNQAGIGSVRGCRVLKRRV